VITELTKGAAALLYLCVRVLVPTRRDEGILIKLGEQFQNKKTIFQ
jgi:hypothetical protein